MNFWYVYKEIKQSKGHSAYSLELFILADIHVPLSWKVI